MVSAGGPVFLRLFDLIFFDDFLTLYHTAAAVSAAVLALLPDSSAAGTVGIVLYLGTGDLLLRFFRRPESPPSA